MLHVYAFATSPEWGAGRAAPTKSRRRGRSLDVRPTRRSTPLGRGIAVSSTIPRRPDAHPDVVWQRFAAAESGDPPFVTSCTMSTRTRPQNTHKG